MRASSEIRRLFCKLLFYQLFLAYRMRCLLFSFPSIFGYRSWNFHIDHSQSGFLFRFLFCLLFYIPCPCPPATRSCNTSFAPSFDTTHAAPMGNCPRNELVFIVCFYFTCIHSLLQEFN